MDTTKVIKYVGIGLIVIVALAIVTGNLGGAKNATKNYHEVMTGQR